MCHSRENVNEHDIYIFPGHSIVFFTSQGFYDSNLLYHAALQLFSFQHRGGYTYNSRDIMSKEWGSAVITRMMDVSCDKLEFEHKYRKSVVKLHCLRLMELAAARYPNEE